MRADVRIVVFHSCTLRVFLCVVIVVIGLGTSVLKYWLRSGRSGKLAERWHSNAHPNIQKQTGAGWGHWPGRPKSPRYTIVLHARIHDRDTRMIFSDFIQIPQYEHLL